MFGQPKHSDCRAGFASLQVVRLEIFSSRLSHLNDDKSARQGDLVHSPSPVQMRPTTGNGNFLPRPLLPPSSLASIPSLAEQLRGCQRTSAFVLTLTTNRSLTCLHFYRKPQDTAVEAKPSADTTDDVQMETSEPNAAPAPAAATATRKRPRLDLTAGPRERKRGKTMFGLLVGTLNKAKTEGEERSATDAVRSAFFFSVVWTICLTLRPMFRQGRGR